MEEYYNYIKALHLIFVVTWFAGLFYIPRLFIYHIEAADKPSPDREILSDQLKLMTKRLWYIITWPSAVLCTVLAIRLLLIIPGWLEQPWMLIKLAFVVLLIERFKRVRKLTATCCPVHGLKLEFPFLAIHCGA